jgi:hypothetical protein
VVGFFGRLWSVTLAGWFRASDGKPPKAGLSTDNPPAPGTDLTTRTRHNRPRPHPPHSPVTMTGRPAPKTDTRPNPGSKPPDTCIPMNLNVGTAHGSRKRTRSRGQGAADGRGGWARRRGRHSVAGAGAAGRCGWASQVCWALRVRVGVGVAGVLGVADALAVAEGRASRGRVPRDELGAAGCVGDPSWNVSPRTDPTHLPAPRRCPSPKPGTVSTGRCPSSPTTQGAPADQCIHGLGAEACDGYARLVRCSQCMQSKAGTPEESGGLSTSASRTENVWTRNAVDQRVASTSSP